MPTNHPPFEKGNKFWKNKSKYGREKLFETPELLLQAANEFFEWCEENPLIEIDYRGSRKVKIPRVRAFTYQALCLYLNCNTSYFKQFRISLKDKTDEISRGFSTVLGEIDDIIYNQKLTAASANQLNSSIIARDLKLKDGVDMTTNGENISTAPIVDLSHLTLEQLRELRKNKSNP